MSHIPDPVLQLTCHDASLAIKPVFDRFQPVIITSGTLSPIDPYPRLPNYIPVVSRSFTMSLTRNSICPMILTRGSEQLLVSIRYDMRSDPVVARNYGRLLLEMVSIVPDGIVRFFVSYSYMDSIVNTWNETGILKDIMQHKLVFFETQDVVETTLALDNFSLLQVTFYVVIGCTKRTKKEVKLYITEEIVLVCLILLLHTGCLWLNLFLKVLLYSKLECIV